MGKGPNEANSEISRAGIPNPQRAASARRLAKDMLRPSIREDIWALYRRGKFDTAVFEAMKTVEVAVREAGGFAAADIGSPLMSRAFNVDNRLLSDMTAEVSERQALSDLFAGGAPASISDAPERPYAFAVCVAERQADSQTSACKLMDRRVCPSTICYFRLTASHG
jgi:Protein of unknown function (Hypoth_ymh)